MKRDNQAFTLIELLVAIAIIGILAAVVLVSMKSFGAKARSTKALAQLSSVIPSMVSCWGNGGVVNLPDVTTYPYNVNGTTGGEGNNPICKIAALDIPSYGLWPNFNKAGTDMERYYYGGRELDPANGWFMKLFSAAPRDNVTICCNSTMNSCAIIGPYSAWASCNASYSQ